jgi:uncharacterized SAM-binding protein YcdF (DUF218 family)
MTPTIQPTSPPAFAGQTVRRGAWGLFERKPRWSLSWRGRLLVFLLVSGLGIATLFAIHPFLAVTHRVDTDVLIVEGWIHEYAIQAAADEFRSNSYRRVLTTGGPVAGIGRYINDFQTSAGVGGALLRKAGVPDESLQVVPSHTIGRDRTYSAAVALRSWFREHQVTIRSLNIVTEDVHARRTRLLFQKAFGNYIAVGVIAVPNPDYDAKRWWRYSEGIKNVASEGVSYIYARLFFHPSDTPSEASKH